MLSKGEVYNSESIRSNFFQKNDESFFKNFFIRKYLKRDKEEELGKKLKAFWN